jgi:tight adherence protein B
MTAMVAATTSVAGPDPTQQGWALGAGLALIFVALFVAGLFVATRPAREDGPFQRVRDALRRRPPNPAHSLHQVAERASQFAERSLERSGRRRGLEAALEQADVRMRPGEFIVLTSGAAFVAFGVGAVLGGILVAAALAASVVGGSRALLRLRVERRRAQFEAQLEQTLPLMAGSLRAGFGVMQALDAVARESESPTSEEFQRLVMESRLGRDLGDSLDALAARMGSEDFSFVVQAIEINREVGGDLAEVLDKVASTIRDRNRVRRQIQTITAEGRISAVILLALPIVMFFVIQIINPDYLGELTGTGFGQVLLVAGIALMAIGGVWMRRLIRLVF